MITVGIDEVGRGCWAGPLVAAAVILPRKHGHSANTPMIRDSKKLSKAQRLTADIWIRAHATAFGIGWVWPGEIDSLGLAQCVRMAFLRALNEITVPYDEIILDGNVNYLADDPKSKTIIKADNIVACVSAASIIAKVARDEYMTNLDSSYARYKFEKHVGYGTKVHIEALQKHGVSDIHRLSYKPLKAFMS